MGLLGAEKSRGEMGSSVPWLPTAMMVTLFLPLFRSSVIVKVAPLT